MGERARVLGSKRRLAITAAILVCGSLTVAIISHLNRGGASLRTTLARIEREVSERQRIEQQLRDTRDELEQDDAAALADRLERGPMGYDPQLIRAMDRCERLRGRALHSIHMYGARGLQNHWPALAAACRTGQPAER